MKKLLETTLHNFSPNVQRVARQRINECLSVEREDAVEPDSSTQSTTDVDDDSDEKDEILAPPMKPVRKRGGRTGPASSNVTRNLGLSLRRAATTEPAVPPPTITT